MSEAANDRAGRTFIDAYAHVGEPRFGSAEEAVAVMDRWNTERAVLVLGPGIPDLEGLRKARELAGDRIRYMGIPFGETEEQRSQLAQVQIRMGISGMRFMPFELPPNAEVLARLGERGLWLFAINVHESAEITRTLLDWLEDHPEGAIASPHFVYPNPIDEAADDPCLLRDLLRHPRFYAILSRHGGASQQPYPHEDLRPWVEGLIEEMGWEKLMWGSEYPCLYWRNEQIDEARRWVHELGIELTGEQRAAFFDGNARRLFFDDQAPPAEDVAVPAWVEEQFNRDRTVGLFPRTALQVPMSDYRHLLAGYIEASAANPTLRFAEYVASRLGEHPG